MIQNRTRIAVAVATVMSGLGMAPVAHAVHVSPDGLGQYLPGEYYTTNNGMVTEFNISNTSDQVVVVKARFKEAENSRDVFDFNIILSPYDVFPFYLSPGEKGPVMVIPNDYTCTVPNLPVNTPISFENGISSYTGDNADSGSTGYERMNEGHPEFIVMGAGDAEGSLAKLAVHEAVKGGKPAGCAALASYFGTGKPSEVQADNSLQAQANLDALRDAFPNYPEAPIGGLWSLVDAALGVGTAGGRMTALANFCNPNLDSARMINGKRAGLGVDGEGCKFLMTLQRPPQPVPQGPEGTNVVEYMDSYYEPSAAAGNTLGAYVDVNGLQYVDGPKAVENGGLTDASGYRIGAESVTYALERGGLWNAWTNRPGDSAAGIWDTDTDFILTFPTKQFYVDEDVKVGDTAVASARYAGRNPLPSELSPFTEKFVDGESCDTVSTHVWDREEWKPSCEDCGGDDPVVSPSPIPDQPDPTEICTEVAVIEFGEGVLGSSVGVPIDYLLNPFTLAEIGIYGQANINMVTEARGLPAIGAAVIKRVLNGQSDMVAYPHAWDRPENLKGGADSTVTAKGPYTNLQK